MSVAVRVVAFGGEEHLVSQRTSGTLAGMWQFPGGKVDEGESLEEAAVREVFEEVGIVVEIDRPLKVYVDYDLDFVCTIFQSKPYLGLVPKNPEPEKHAHWKWMKHVPEPRLYGLECMVQEGTLKGQP